MIPVFDGHNDLLFRLARAPSRRAAIFLDGDGTGHLDLPRMRAGGFAGGLFAVFVAPREMADPAAMQAAMEAAAYDLPLPLPAAPEPATAAALAQVGHFAWMERASKGAFRACTTVEAITQAMADGAVAGVLHMEGAEAIGPDLDALHLFHALGLRSLGPVWSRPNVFGHGVPFRFPGDPDCGPGLTEAGRALVREAAALGMVIDLSHITAQGFDDVARETAGPLVATHSNAHAVTPSTRNLTDRQLAMIAERDGMVGLNLATVFLRPDGRQDPACGWDPILRHLDHLLDRLGEDRVGLGSDFDGATVPSVIADAAGLPRLSAALEAHGYGAALVEKFAHRNWLRLLGRVWGETT